MVDSINCFALRERLGGRNLFLVGMMGSGKSCTGPFLAKELGYRFVDADEVIEKAAKKSISTIFFEEGEDSFRKIETQVMQSIGQHYSLVVATGGGVITRPANWGVLHQGIVIWLDPGAQRLYKRVRTDPTDRPLLNKVNSFELFEALYNEREHFYKESDLHIFYTVWKALDARFQTVQLS